MCYARSRWKSRSSAGEQLIALGRRARAASWASVCSTGSGQRSQRMHAVLESGALGEVQAATMMVPWWRPQSYYDEPGRGVLARDGGGVLITQAIHSLDLFRWLVGIEQCRGGAGAHHGAASHGD